MTHPLIAEHRLIGDLQNAALVTTDGTIDWFCCPRFDSPSEFASLLDDGGRSMDVVAIVSCSAAVPPNFRSGLSRWTATTGRSSKRTSSPASAGPHASSATRPHQRRSPRPAG
jgi:GH15 family glucan-1,4-alpha-glucosidase